MEMALHSDTKYEIGTGVKINEMYTNELQTCSSRILQIN